MKLKLDEEKESELWKSYRNSKTPDNLNALCVFYQPLVHANAAYFFSLVYSRMVEFDELFSAGNLGLLKGILLSRPEKEKTFRAYLVVKIRGAIMDYVRGNQFLPVYAQKELKRYRNAVDKLTAKTGQTPSDDDIAKEMRITKKKAQDLAFFSAMKFLSVECSIEKSKEKTAQVLQIVDPAFTPEEWLILQDTLKRAMAKLKPKERSVIELYSHGYNQREIARKLGCTEAYVSILKKRALEKMRAFGVREGEQHE